VEETGVPGENHRSVASHAYTLSHNNPYNYNIIKMKKLCFQELWHAIERNDLDLAEECIRLKADVNYFRDVSCVYRHR
jgi:hypothetical protein